MKNKKPLYIVLFILLNFIEWLKGTQNGYVWMTGVNCIGFVMMVMIASAYPLKLFWNRFSGIWTAVCAVIFGGVYWYWQYNIYMTMVWKYLTGVLNLWWIGIAAYVVLGEFKNRLARQNEKTWWRNIKWQPLAVLGLVMAALMLVSDSGRLWPLWFLFMFGMFYITEYTEKDKQALIDGFVDGNIISFFMMQIFAYGFRPYDEVRYKGALTNCNMMALYYLIIYSMVLFKIHQLKRKKAHKGWLLFWTFGAGGLISFLFMTICRSAWVSCALLTAVYGVLAMKVIWADTWKKIVAKGALLAACAVVTFPMVFLTIRWLPTILHHPVWFADEYSEDKVHSFDPADSWKYVEFDEFWEEAVGRIIEMLFAAAERNPFLLNVYAKETQEDALQEEVLQEEGPILKPPTWWDSGEVRKAIWKAYWSDLNLRGRGETEGHYWITQNYHSWHAQNVWLQIAYFYGIPAGIAFVLLTVYMLYYYIRRFWNGTHHSTNGLLPILVLTIFFSFGFMEAVWIPGQLILCLFFLVQHPMFRQKEEEK